MIVVTGGAGFIGSNIIKGLNDRGIKDILVVDDMTDGEKHKNLNRLEFLDYIDYREFLVILDKFAFKKVFHQGACSDTTQRDGKYMMETNYQYSRDLWNHCTAKRIDFIYASSASVYGDGKLGFKEEAVNEYPLNVYAFSKYQFDRYVRSRYKSFSSQTVGLRYFNVYGPQECHKGKMASVPYHMFNQVKNGQAMKLFEGSENFKRDFIHVDDVVKVNLFFHDHPEHSGVYNCGTGRAESFSKIAGTLQSIYPNAKLDIVPFPAELVGKYQDYTQADISSLTAAGYTQPFMTVEDGVKRYIQTLEKSDGYIK